MQSQFITPAADDLRFASAEVMRITLGQLRTWQVEAARQVILPQPEEDAWEGTELDARRTVL